MCGYRFRIVFASTDKRMFFTEDEKNKKKKKQPASATANSASKPSEQNDQKPHLCDSVTCCLTDTRRARASERSRVAGVKLRRQCATRRRIKGQLGSQKWRQRGREESNQDSRKIKGPWINEKRETVRYLSRTSKNMAVRKR